MREDLDWFDVVWIGGVVGGHTTPVAAIAYRQQTLIRSAGSGHEGITCVLVSHSQGIASVVDG